MKAPGSVIHFPKQSKPTPEKKKPCTVLEWIRNGYQFPGKPVRGGVS